MIILRSFEIDKIKRNLIIDVCIADMYRYKHDENGDIMYDDNGDKVKLMYIEDIQLCGRGKFDEIGMNPDIVWNTFNKRLHSYIIEKKPCYIIGEKPYKNLYTRKPIVFADEIPEGREIPEGYEIYDGEEFEAQPQQIRLKIDVDGICNDTLFYLKVKAASTESELTDFEDICLCGSDKKEINAVTFYKYNLYKNIACYANALDTCTPPHEFIDYLMRLKALEASIVINDVDKINYYFDWLVKNNKFQGGSRYKGKKFFNKPHCGCNRL